jgi:hypothetical protein
VDDLDKFLDDVARGDQPNEPDEFEGTFGQLQSDFRNKFGFDFRTTGTGNTPLHRKLSGGRARDIGARDLSTEQQQYVMGRARELGLDVVDQTNPKKLLRTSKGTHIHVGKYLSGRGPASSNLARGSGSDIDQFLDEVALDSGDERSTLAESDAIAEKEFQSWYAERARRLNLGLDPDDPRHHYDYRAAFQAGAEPDANGHWPSQFKQPDHPNRYVDGNDTITGEPARDLSDLSDEDFLQTILEGATRPRRALTAGESGNLLPQPKQAPGTGIPGNTRTPQNYQKSIGVQVGDLRATGALTRDTIGDRVLESLGFKPDERKALKNTYAKRGKGLPWLPPKDQISGLAQDANGVAQIGVDSRLVGQLQNSLKEMRALKTAAPRPSRGLAQQADLVKQADQIDQEVQHRRQQLSPALQAINQASMPEEERATHQARFNKVNEELALMSDQAKHLREMAAGIKPTATPLERAVTRRRALQLGEEPARYTGLRELPQNAPPEKTQAALRELQVEATGREQQIITFKQAVGEMGSGPLRDRYEAAINNLHDELVSLKAAIGRLSEEAITGQKRAPSLPELKGFIHATQRAQKKTEAAVLEGEPNLAVKLLEKALNFERNLDPLLYAGELAKRYEAQSGGGGITDLVKYLADIDDRARRTFYTVLAADTVSGIGAVLPNDVLGRGFAATGKQLSEQLKKGTPHVDEAATDTLRTVIVPAAASAAAFFAGGVAAKGVGLGARAGRLISGLLSQSGANYEEALVNGATPEQARTMAAIGAATGLSEELGFPRIFGKVGKGGFLSRFATNVLESAPEELAQETGSQLLQEYFKKLAIDPEHNPATGFTEAAIGALAVSLLFGGGGAFIEGRGRTEVRGQESEVSPELAMVGRLMEKGRSLSPERARSAEAPQGEVTNDRQDTIPETVRTEAAPQEQQPEVSGEKPAEELPAEAPQQVGEARRVIVHSDDGRVGVIQIGKEGRAEFNEVTNPKSAKKYTEAAYTLPPDEFDGLFPNNPDGYMPGAIATERMLFLRDEKLLEKGVEGSVVEPEKPGLPEREGTQRTEATEGTEATARVSPEVTSAPGQKTKAPAPRVETGEVDAEAHLEKFDRALQEEYQTAVEHVKRTRFATEALLEKKMTVSRERASELLNRMESEGAILRDQNGRRFVPKTQKGGRSVEDEVQNQGRLSGQRQIGEASEGADHRLDAALEAEGPSSGQQVLTTPQAPEGEITAAPSEQLPPQTPREKFLEAVRRKREERAGIKKGGATHAVETRKEPKSRVRKHRRAEPRTASPENGPEVRGEESAQDRRGDRAGHGAESEQQKTQKRQAIAKRIKQRLTQGGTVRETTVEYNTRRGLPYERRPDANRKASRLAAAAVSDLESLKGRVSDTQLPGRPGGERNPPSATRVHAVGITEPLKRDGRINLRGMLARTHLDVAQLAQVYRDPRFETFRIIYTKGDEIVAHEGLTSRLPGSASAFAVDDFSARKINELDHLMRAASGAERLRLSRARDRAWNTAVNRQVLLMAGRMKRLGADGYYLLHNHPSGEPYPSYEDRELTSTYEEKLPGFRGHVIVNSGEYGLLSPGGASVAMHKLVVPPEKLLVPSVPNRALNWLVTGADDVAIIGKRFQSEGWVPIIYRTSLGEVRAIEEVPRTLFAQTKDAAGFITNRKRKFGSVDAFAFSDQVEDLGPGMRLVEKGALTDHVHPSVGAREMGVKPRGRELIGKTFKVGETSEASLAELPVELRDDLVELARSFIDEGKNLDELVDEYESLLGEDFDKIADYLPAVFDEATKGTQGTKGTQERVPLASGKPEDHAATLGKESRAVTPRGMEVRTRFAVFPADQLITSHDIELRPNPHFPEGVQNRDRAKVSSDDDLLEKIRRFEPEYLGESIEAGKGAPIVGPDMAVESGNGRTILLRRLYRDHPQQASNYKAWLLQNAKKFGLDRAAIEQLEQPVLARIRTTQLTPAERIQFAEQANEETQLKLSPVEVARGDARKLNAQAMATFAPNEDGEIVATANRNFIQHFLDEIVGPNRGDVLTDDGRLSQVGVARIRNAIFAKAYGDTAAGLQALEKLSESPDDNVRRITNALVYNAGRFAALKDKILAGSRFPVDISADLAEAARKLSALREQGTNVEDYLRQKALFGEELSRFQKKVLYVFNEFKHSAKAINGILGRYFAGVEALGDPRQGGFFATSPPTKEELFEAALEEAIHGQGEQSGFFGQQPETTLGGPDKKILFESEPGQPGSPGPAPAPRDETQVTNPQAGPERRPTTEGETPEQSPDVAPPEAPRETKPTKQKKAKSAPKSDREPESGETGGGVDDGRSGSPSDLGEGVNRLIIARQEHTRAGDLSRIPAHLNQFLAPHQKEGVAKAIAAMSSRTPEMPGGFLLADGTGAGKTRQILAAAENFRAKGHPVVIIAPAEVLKPNWKKGEVAGSYANDAKAMGLSYELKRAGALEPGKIRLTTYENLGTLSIPKGTYVVFDESHALKNADSNRSRLGREIIDRAEGVLFATATPADKPTHIEYLARAGVLEGQTVEKAFEDLGLIQRKVRDKKGGHKYIWEIDPHVGTEQVLKRIDELFDRLTRRGLMIKRELSMEGIDIEFKQIKLSPEAKSVMGRIDAGFGGLANAAGLLKARILMHMRRQQEPYKIAPVVEMAKKEINEGRQVVIFMARISQSEAGMDVYDKNGEIIGRKVFAESEGTAKSLKEALIAAGISDITELHGKAALSADQAMAEFQSGKKRVLIATTESGGTGINLDDVTGDRPRTLIMMTAPFSAVTNVQASGRVWRMRTKTFPRIKYIFSDLDVDKWNAGIIATKMRSLKATVRGEVERMAVNPDELATPIIRPGEEGLSEPESFGLTTDEYDRVVRLKESLDKRGELVGDYLRQQGLFGEELSDEQKTLLRELDTRGRKGKTKSEQPTLFGRAEDGGLGGESFGRLSLTEKSITRARDLTAEAGEGDVEDFKVSQRALNILKEIGVPGAEKYLPKRLAGIYKLRSKNVRVKSLFDVFVVAHEGTHAISHRYNLIDDMIADTEDQGGPFKSAQVRKDLTAIYEQYYPGGSSSHPLKLRMEEGFATVVEHYLYDPATIQAEYPRLIADFLTPGGRYYHAATSRLLDSMNSLVDDYAKMKPWQRIGARVVSGPEVVKVDKGFDAAERIIYETVNQFEPLKRAGVTGEVSGTLEDPFVHAFTQMGRGSIIHSWIKGKNTLVLDQDGNWDQEAGTVKDYLKLIKGREKEFDTLLVARRVVEDHNRLMDLRNRMAKLEAAMEADPEKTAGLTPIYEALKEQALNIARILKNDDFNLQDANATVNKYGKDVTDALKVYDRINKRLVDFAENTGLIKPEFAQEIRARKGYSSWIRKINDEVRESAGQLMGGKSSQTKARSFKARGGATLDIISPTYNQITAIGEIIGKGLDNMIWQRVYDLSLKHAEIGRRFEKMETQTAVGPEGRIIYPQDRDPNLLKVWLDGERVYVKPAPEFMAVAKNLRGKEWDLFANLIRMPSALFTRLTTSANPIWAAGNLTIDQVSALLNTKTGFKPLVDPLHSFAEFLREVRVTKQGIGLSGTGEFEKYLELGGKRQTFASQYEVAPEKTIASILGRKSTLQRAGHVVDLGLSVLELPSNLSEYLTRFSEFRRAKQMGKSDVEAMALAAEVTTPFQLRGHMGGSFGQAWRDSLPYFNAALQVMYKFGQTTQENPARVATVASGLLAAAFTAAIATFRSADDEQKRELANLPARELGKAIFIPSPLGKSLIRIRVPEQIGGLTALAYLFIAQHYGRNKVKLDDVLNSLSAALPSQLDVLEPKKIPLALLPQAVSPTVQVLTNTKFYPELLPIVPDSLKDKPVEMQYTAYTSKVGKAIGRALGIAPAKVDFWIKNQIGAVGSMLIGKMPQNPLSRQEEGFQMAGRAYNNFYSERQVLDQQYQRLNSPNSFSPEEQERIVQTHATYTDLAGVLTRMRKQLAARGNLPEPIKQKAFETLAAIDRGEPIEKVAPMVDELDTATAALAEPGAVRSQKHQLVSERLKAMIRTDTYKGLSKSERADALKEVIERARREASVEVKTEREPKPVDVATFSSELAIEKSRILFELARDPDYKKLRPFQKEFIRQQLSDQVRKLAVKIPEQVEDARQMFSEMRDELRAAIREMVESAKDLEKVSER